MSVTSKREVLENSGDVHTPALFQPFKLRDITLNWPLHAAHALHYDVEWLPQYVRAKN